MTPRKQRIDQLLVERRLAETREKARALILAGHVLVDGQRQDKAGHAVRSDARIEILERPRFVSRGGMKLEAALNRFGVSVEGKICLDVGSSTGGFTDCLLQRGARRVYAIDVGTGQLDWKLRKDARVVVQEQVNARHLSKTEVPEAVDLAVCDVSFISVTMILPVVPPLMSDAGEMIILVKPQFELEKRQIGKGGIVRDACLHQRACDRAEAAVRELGFAAELMPSPILGAEGNQEFLLHAKRRHA